MTLYNIVSILKAVAASQPNIRTTTDGSVYDALNTNPAIQYDVFHISQTTHRESENYDYYGFNLFYISRLEDSLEDNRLQIQSIGKEVLSNIIRTLCENWSIDYPEITYFPFTQKFNDLTAGVYCALQLDVPKELWCADDYIAEVVPGSGLKLQDIGITITENGLRVVTPDAEYDGIGEIRIVTDVPQTTADLQYKEVEYTENGEYVVRPDQDYDGLTEVAVSINVPQGQGYDEGYADGVANQKAKLSAITITENGDYNREDGYSAITVNVPSIITNQEKNIVINDNTNPLTWFPELGAYALQTPLRVSADSGYTGIEPAVVDVYCDASEAIQYGYNEGYADGFAAGASACSGFFITALTLNVDSAITDYGTATTTYSPATAITDIYYTSSDPSIASIDSGTGAITVYSSGTVTICAIDSITHLQDCKQVNVTKTPEPVLTDYLTIESIDDCNVYFTQNQINDTVVFDYRINKGNWNHYSGAQVGERTLISSLNQGDKLEIRGTNRQLETGSVHISYPSFYCDGRFNVSGNVLSIIYGDDYPNHSSYTVSYGLADMFADNSYLISAENLVLPQVVGVGVLSSMFQNCRNLTTAPVLPAATLSQSSYVDMFRNCASLNYIKCLATDISATNCTYLWVSGVASTGTFVKDPNMSDWTIGESGIPSGWTITDNT